MNSDNISEILSSKPHNKHYLKRYIKFIYLCNIKNVHIQKGVYTENHHICPKSKSMFPEYKSLKLFPWNKAILTFRQHIIAHYLLAKVYNNWECWEAIRRTANQNIKIPTKTIGVQTLKLIDYKIKQTKKGIFTRGYDKNGNPNVKESTKKLLREQKLKYYSIPENKQKAKKIRASSSYSEVNKISSERFTQLNISRTGIPLSETHKQNSKINQIEALKDPLKRGAFKGLYITPIGVGSSVHSLNGLCKYSSNEIKIINKFITSHSNIFPESVIGKSFFELGFYFVPKDDPKFAQFREFLDQVHLPEPNHVLWSELNDFLLHEKLLH